MMRKFIPVVAVGVIAIAEASADVSEICYTPVDIVQVQDMTSSFDDRWPAMSAQIGDVMNSIYEINPNSRFGFATFGDKPFYPLGYESDYCLHVDVQLSQPTPQAMTELFENYRAKAQGGGADWPEAVLEGLERTLLAPQVGWETRTNSSKVVVVVTDASSHLPGDVAKIGGIKVQGHSLSSDDLQSNENNKCSEIDYPSFEQVAKVMADSNAQVIFIVAPGGSYDSNGNFSPAASLANQGKKYWKEDGLQLWYEDMFAAVGVKAFVETMDPKMNIYAEAFKKALEKYQAWRCATTTTTTPEPTTTTTTTPEPTATTTTTPEPTTTTTPEPTTTTTTTPEPTTTTTTTPEPTTTTTTTPEPTTTTTTTPEPTTTPKPTTTATTTTTTSPTTVPLTVGSVETAATTTTSTTTSPIITLPATVTMEDENCCNGCCGIHCGCGWDIQVEVVVDHCC